MAVLPPPRPGSSLFDRSGEHASFAALPETGDPRLGMAPARHRLPLGGDRGLCAPALWPHPLFAVPMTVAVWLIDGSTPAAGRTAFGPGLKAAFGAGWWLGFGYFLTGLWWIGAACLVDGDKFLWVLPLAVVALPVYLAAFTGAGFALARLLWRPGPLRVFALAFGLGLTEWARGFVLHRLSLERPRHGARRQSQAGADRLGDRPARPGLRGGRDLRGAGDPLGRARGAAFAGADALAALALAGLAALRRRPADRRPQVRPCRT